MKKDRSRPILFTLSAAMGMVCLFVCLSSAEEPDKGPARAAYGKIPLFFTKNEGQVDPKAEYYTKGPSSTIWVTRDGLVFDFFRREAKEKDGKDGQEGKGGREKIEPKKPGPDSKEPEKVERLVFTLELAGRDEASRIEAGDPQEGKVNYFIGNDPSKWKTGVPTFGSLTYKGVWEGVDLVLKGREGGLKYEFHLAPGADPGKIALAYKGIESLKLAEGGGLVVETAFGAMEDEKPHVFQEAGGKKTDVEGKFKIIEGSKYGFEIASYDKAKPLVIDPALCWPGGPGETATPRAR